LSPLRPIWCVIRRLSGRSVTEEISSRFGPVVILRAWLYPEPRVPVRQQSRPPPATNGPDFCRLADRPAPKAHKTVREWLLPIQPRSLSGMLTVPNCLLLADRAGPCKFIWLHRATRKGWPRIAVASNSLRQANRGARRPVEGFLIARSAFCAPAKRHVERHRYDGSARTLPAFSPGYQFTKFDPKIEQAVSNCHRRGSKPASASIHGTASRRRSPPDPSAGAFTEALTRKRWGGRPRRHRCAKVEVS
jgi:hypothetical protein